jgi:hypothetical protein
MSLPAPAAGLVIRYSFLWRRDAERGAAEGAKDRPCAIVIALKRESGSWRAVVAPVTHTKPEKDAPAIELPVAVRIRLGLDEERQWIRYDELNAFDWPGFDLRPVPGTDKYVYGMLPRPLYEKLRSAILGRAATGGLRPTER